MPNNSMSYLYIITCYKWNEQWDQLLPWVHCRTYCTVSSFSTIHHDMGWNSYCSGYTVGCTAQSHLVPHTVHNGTGWNSGINYCSGYTVGHTAQSHLVPRYTLVRDGTVRSLLWIHCRTYCTVPSCTTVHNGTGMEQWDQLLSGYSVGHTA